MPCVVSRIVFNIQNFEVEVKKKFEYLRQKRPYQKESSTKT